MGDWTWDVEADALFAHAGVWRLHGAPNRQGSAPAAWFVERQHPEDREWVAVEIKKAQSERQPLDVEYRVIWPDSSIHWVNCRAVAVFDGRGKLVQMSGID